jgi:6-phosphogluconolactonase
MKKITLYFLSACFFVLLFSFSFGQGNNEHYLLVGTYTTSTSKGIYVYKFNSKTGDFNIVSTTTTDNPSYLCVAPDKKYVYAVNEGKGDKAGVTAFIFDKSNGYLHLLNREPSGGDDPCYVNIDKSGKWVTVGNYSGGSLSVLPVMADGSLGKPTTITHNGSSVNKDRQEKAHVHCTMFSPDYKYLFVSDLGMDKVMTYSFNPGSGKLTPAPTPFTTVEPGSGPRHFEFSPSGKFAYLMEELGGTISAYSYKDGKLTFIERVPSLPKDYKGTKSGADIHISKDGKFLYGSNRGESNTIVIYSVDQKTGKLTYVGHQSTMGKIPRNFNFDPSGDFVLVANQETDDIFIFKRDAATGKLTPTGKKISVPKPVCIKWVP